MSARIPAGERRGRKCRRGPAGPCGDCQGRGAWWAGAECGTRSLAAMSVIVPVVRSGATTVVRSPSRRTFCSRLRVTSTSSTAFTPMRWQSLPPSAPAPLSGGESRVGQGSTSILPPTDRRPGETEGDARRRNGARFKLNCTMIDPTAMTAQRPPQSGYVGSVQ